MNKDIQLPLVPIGTQVVAMVSQRDRFGVVNCAEGAVGVVVHQPTDSDYSYQVKLTSGADVFLYRNEFRPRKELQREGLVVGEIDFAPYVVYRCVIGSRAYGLASDDSDTDVRGVYLPPADLEWALWGVPEQIERKEPDAVYWEFGQFLRLALKANPSILECLWSPLVELHLAGADALLVYRDRFLSKLVYQTYNGYALSQFKKIEQDIRNQNAVKWKHAMHLCRLLMAGAVAMRERRIVLEIPEERERLLAIRRGELPWSAVNNLRQSLHDRFDYEYARTTLPDRPDYAMANRILIDARRAMATP